jgi:tight adherence protein C
MPRYRQTILRKLREAGQESVAFEEFMAEQEMWAILVPLGLFLTDIVTDPLWLLLLAATAFYVPYIRLGGKIKRTKKQILADLPFLIDLLMLSVEAGSGFDQAIRNIIENFPERPLKYELQLMSKNLQAGNSIAEALGAMRDRLNILEVSGFCSSLIQAGQMGTGLAVTLREQSAYIKKKRFEQRREAAKKAATLMVIPLLLFVFPAMFLVILGPVAIKMYYQFFGG